MESEAQDIQVTRSTGSRNLFPLKQAQTPHFLQKFTFRSSGTVYTFDERQFFPHLYPALPLAPPQEPIMTAMLERLKQSRAPGDKRSAAGLLLPQAKRAHINAAELVMGTATEEKAPSSPLSDDMSLLSPSASPGPGAHAQLEVAETAIATTNGTPSYRSCIPQSRNSTDVLNSLREIPRLSESFSSLPRDLHRYALWRLFQDCDRSTLSTMVEILQETLRLDMLAMMPAELVAIVLSYLDMPALCAASQVSRKWYSLIEENDDIWRQLLNQDQLVPTEKETARAVFEAWGYTGWSKDGEVNHSGKGAVNAFGKPVNLYKAIYRRKLLIAKNWMSPNSKPRHYSIPCHAQNSQEVITCLEFDEDRIIAGSDGKYINIWDTRTGELLHHLTDHEGGVWALKYINKDTLVSAGVDRTVRIWSISNARCTHVFRGHTSTVRCLDVVMPVVQVDPITNMLNHLPTSPLIVTGSRDASLRIWRLPSKQDESYYGDPADTADEDNPFFVRALRGHTNPVRAISGYGDLVVSGSYDMTVRVWRLSTGECLWELTGHRHKVYSAVIDPKRNRCITASLDWSVKVWCIQTGTLLYSLEGHTSLVSFVNLREATLVSAAADSTLRVWNPETGSLIHKLVGHQGPVTCFQHDEKKVVSGSEKSLKLWNIQTGQLVGDLFESMDLLCIWQVGFDSRRCVSAVKRGDCQSYLEVLDFDYDPTLP